MKWIFKDKIAWCIAIALTIVSFWLGWMVKPQPDLIQECVSYEDFMTECPYCDKQITIKITKEKLPGSEPIMYGYNIELYKGWPKGFTP